MIFSCAFHDLGIKLKYWPVITITIGNFICSFFSLFFSFHDSKVNVCDLLMLLGLTCVFMSKLACLCKKERLSKKSVDITVFVFGKYLITLFNGPFALCFAIPNLYKGSLALIMEIGTKPLVKNLIGLVN